MACIMLLPILNQRNSEAKHLIGNATGHNKLNIPSLALVCHQYRHLS